MIEDSFEVSKIEQVLRIDPPQIKEITDGEDSKIEQISRISPPIVEGK